MVQETSMKKIHSEERKEPYNTLNRTEQTTLNKNWVQKRKENNKINTVTKDKRLGKKRKKVALRREKGALQHPKQNRTDNIEEELSEKWPQKKKRRKETLYRKGALQKC